MGLKRMLGRCSSWLLAPGHGTYPDLDLRAFTLPLLPGEGRAVDGWLLTLGQLWPLLLYDLLRTSSRKH